MTEDESRRFKSIEALRAAAYITFNDRRGHEWKLSLSIWTSLAILLAGLIQPIKQGEVFPLRGSCVWVWFAIAGIVIVILHALWNNWASKANNIDNTSGRYFRNEMMNILSLHFEADLIEKIEKLPKTVGWRQTSHLVQIGITAVLVFGVVLVVYFRAP